jgi:hypothetical protein
LIEEFWIEGRVPPNMAGIKVQNGSCVIQISSREKIKG